jgi:hypothetical protein
LVFINSAVKMPHAGIVGLARALQNGQVYPANGPELRMDTDADRHYPFFPVKSGVRLLANLSLALSFAHAVERPPMAHAMIGVANGCFVESVAFLDTWHERMGGESWANGAQPANQNPSARDATIAGEKLARHRPGNRVSFKWRLEADRHENAAAVFPFGDSAASTRRNAARSLFARAVGSKTCGGSASFCCGLFPD